MKQQLVNRQSLKSKKPSAGLKRNNHQDIDPLEVEADAMAERIMRHGEQKQTGWGIIGRQADDHATADSDHHAPVVKGRLANHVGGYETSSSLTAAIDASMDRGRDLPHGIRNFMENAFSHDFSRVRIHDDAEAVQLADEANANAFTRGNDIYFALDRFQTGTASGKRLIAHELTHVIQQGHAAPIPNHIQRDEASTIKKPVKKSILEAEQQELEEYLKQHPSTFGYIEKSGQGINIYLTNFKAKEYLVKSDLAWLKAKPVQLPNYERKTNQIAIWKEAVKAKIIEQFQTLSGSNDQQKSFMLTLKSKDRKQPKIKKGISGTFSQLAEETSIPFWNINGIDNLYDVEHMVDWQIAGSFADDINNLILLDRAYNRSLGNKIKAGIAAHMDKVSKHFSGGFTGLSGNADTLLKKFNVKDSKIYIKNFDTTGSVDLSDEKWYFKDELISLKEKGNPFTTKIIEVKDFKIPEGYFVLRTNSDRSGYFLPYQAKNEQIGAWSVTADYDKQKDELKSISFQVLFKDTHGVMGKKGDLVQGNKKIKGSTDAKDGDPDAAEIKPDKKESHVYEVNSEQLRRRFGRVFKELYGEVRELSPINLSEPKLDGFDVSATGKVDPTLSFLKGVDIEYGIENGDYYIQAVVPLDKLAANFPKPFKVDTCNLVIRASSDEGLSVAGIIAFGVGSFGKGEISAGVDKRGVNFTGSFDFNSKWFSKSNVTVSYVEGAWGISGSVAIDEGKIPGVKGGSLDVSYISEVFNAHGLVTFTVPGLKQLDITATVDKKGDFAIGLETALGELPGIKGGRVKLLLKSMADTGDIQLSVEGDAIPNLPNVPNISPKLHFLYDNGKFDVNTEVDYNKGRFSGKIMVGVTNRTVDEQGKPTGADVAAEDSPVVIYGFGELTAILFKDNKGTVSVRLTPAGDVLVAASISFNNLKPFGEGTHFTKPIFELPTIDIPLFGIPGMSISAFIKGGVFFKFNWEPLVLKNITISLLPTDIRQLENAALAISGSVGSMADAEVYLTIDAGLKARVLIATLSGSIGGEAGLGLHAEAGGALAATWSVDKGLQFQEIRAFLDVEPRALFRLVGKISVDLDLWITTINLYYHEWVFANKAIDLSGLALKVDFPIAFDANNNVLPPNFEKMNVQKPDFSGDAGKNILDNALNSDAKKEEEAKREKIKADIKYDLRTKGQKDGFSLSEYTEKMRKKYDKSKELQDFVIQTIEDESRKIEQERFERTKSEIRAYNIPLQSKLTAFNIFTMFNMYITDAEKEAFREELRKTDEARILIEQQTAAMKAEADRLAAEEKERERQATSGREVRPDGKAPKPTSNSKASR